LGQHTREILSSMAGLESKEIEELESQKTISTNKDKAS